MSKPVGETSRRTLLKSTAAAVAVPSALAGCAPEDGNRDGNVQPDTDPGVVLDTDAMDTDGFDTDALDTDPVDDGLVYVDIEAVPQDDRTFPWSLCAGAMTASQVLITSKAIISTKATLWIWKDVGRTDAIDRVYEEDLVPGDAGFVSADVDGLEPGTWYHHALVIVGPSGTPNSRSLIGRFRTAPAAGTNEPLTVALSACNGDERGFNSAFGRIAEHDVDMILHLGDLAYNDSAEDLAQYRASWATWMESPGYRRALASTGLYVTWDDHEVDNNWNPETISAARKEAALQAFLETVPTVTGPGGVLWTSWRWGDTLEVFQLDCRSERLPSTLDNDDDSDDVYISPEQMTWLKDGLDNSPCHFKIVMTSVPITKMPWFGISADDRWEGYPGQRDELLGHIQDEDLRNVWFVGGDFHVNFVGKTDVAPTGRLASTYEIAVTSGNINPAAIILLPPQVQYNSFQPRTVLATFDPVLDQVTVTFLNPQNGQVDRRLVLRQP